MSDWLELCFNIMYDYTPNDFSTREARQKFAQISNHADTVGEYFYSTLKREKDYSNIVDKFTKLSELFYWNGIGYKESAQFNHAIDAFKKDMAICEKMLGINHEDTAATYNDIALCL
jgi:hypothetical protein